MGVGAGARHLPIDACMYVCMDVCTCLSLPRAWCIHSSVIIVCRFVASFCLDHVLEHVRTARLHRWPFSKVNNLRGRRGGEGVRRDDVISPDIHTATLK